MPIAAVAIPAAAAVIGAGINYFGQHEAGNQQQEQSQAALDFAKAQAAQQQANYVEQQRLAQAQWEARQKALAPYRAAASSIFAKYGITAPAGGWQGGGAMPPGGAVAGAGAPSPVSLAQIARRGFTPYQAPSYAGPTGPEAMVIGAPAAPGAGVVSPYAAAGELAGIPQAANLASLTGAYFDPDAGNA